MHSTIRTVVGLSRVRSRAAMRRVAGLLAAALFYGICAAPRPADAAAFLWVAAPTWSYSAALASSPFGTFYGWGLSIGAGSFSYAYAYSYSVIGPSGAAAYAIAKAGFGGAGAWVAAGFADPFASTSFDLPLPVSTSNLLTNSTATNTAAITGAAGSGTPWTVTTTGITFGTGAGTELNGFDAVEALLYTGPTDQATLCGDFGESASCTTGTDKAGVDMDFTGLISDLGAGNLSSLGVLTDPSNVTTLTFNHAITLSQESQVILVAEGEVPEPASLLLLGQAFAAMGLMAAWRSRRAA